MSKNFIGEFELSGNTNKLTLLWSVRGNKYCCKYLVYPGGLEQELASQRNASDLANNR